MARADTAMTIDEFAYSLDARGVNYERDGAAFTVKDSLNLRSLTTLPEGVSLTAGGYLDLRSLTTLPEGVSLTAGGSLDLRSLTTLPEGVSLTAGGYLDLSSLTTEDQIYQGKTIRLRTIDGYTMRLISKRKVGSVTLWSAQYFKGDLKADPRSFVAQDGETYAHGETAEAALRDIRFKIAQRDFDVDDLVSSIKARGTVEFNDYRLLTGACEAGTRAHLLAHGINPDETASLPLSKALEISRSGYGGDVFARLIEAA